MRWLELKWSDEAIWKKVRPLGKDENQDTVILFAEQQEHFQRAKYGQFTAAFRISEDDPN